MRLLCAGLVDVRASGRSGAGARDERAKGGYRCGRRTIAARFHHPGASRLTAAPILVVTGLAREARIAAGPGVVALAGGTAAALAERIEAAVRRHQPEAIVSFGLAGALAPGLLPGDLLAGSAVLAGADRVECDLEWRGAILAVCASPRSGERDSEVLVLGAEAMITHAAAKRSLHAETGAAVVDMESAAAARVAAAHGLPLAVIAGGVGQRRSAACRRRRRAGMAPDGGMNLGGGAGLAGRATRASCRR